MRLFRSLPALALILGARASVHRARDNDRGGDSDRDRHDNDVLELLDVCAYIEADITEHLGIVNTAGHQHLEVCLCLSALPVFIQANAVAIATAKVAGIAAVNELLTALINGAAPSSNCYYPDHSKPRCEGRNPCAFDCTDGFSHDSDDESKECKCKAPNQICNGKCVPKGACPSQKPHEDRRRWLGSGSCAERGHGWVACGVYGGGPRSWECVNTARDLESCGGCVVPLTAYSPQGKDCTAIPGVADVACHYGECAVRRCLPGLVPSADGSRCVLKHPKSMQDYPAETYEEVYDPEYEQARVYGLEHVPLDRQ